MKVSLTELTETYVLGLKAELAIKEIARAVYVTWGEVLAVNRMDYFNGWINLIVMLKPRQIADFKSNLWRFYVA